MNSLIELLIALGIGILLVGISFFSFSGLVNYNALDKDSSTVISYIQNARNLTLSSKNYKEYGVHFASSTVTVFPGTSYSNSSENLVYTLNPRVVIKSIDLVGGGNDFYFNKVTGKPSASGAITLSLIPNNSNSSSTRTISIYATGLSE